MKKFYTLLIALLFTSAAFSQIEVKLSELSQHVGDSVTVTGPVLDGRFLERSQNAPTFLNVGEKYPNQLLTLVVWGYSRPNFKESPELFYKLKTVKVSGKVELYRGKPQIVLYSDKQVTLLSDDTGSSK